MNGSAKIPMGLKGPSHKVSEGTLWNIFYSHYLGQHYCSHWNSICALTTNMTILILKKKKLKTKCKQASNITVG